MSSAWNADASILLGGETQQPTANATTAVLMSTCTNDTTTLNSMIGKYSGTEAVEYWNDNRSLLGGVISHRHCSSYRARSPYIQESRYPKVQTYIQGSRNPKIQKSEGPGIQGILGVQIFRIRLPCIFILGLPVLNLSYLQSTAGVLTIFCASGKQMRRQCWRQSSLS